jgi:hypothetical protein
VRPLRKMAARRRGRRNDGRRWWRCSSWATDVSTARPLEVPCDQLTSYPATRPDRFTTKGPATGIHSGPRLRRSANVVSGALCCCLADKPSPSRPIRHVVLARRPWPVSCSSRCLGRTQQRRTAHRQRSRHRDRAAAASPGSGRTPPRYRHPSRRAGAR